MFTILLIVLKILHIYCDNYTLIDLYSEHLPYYISNYPTLSKLCHEDEDCPYKEHLQINRCWGYEDKCLLENRFSKPVCPGEHNGWTKTKKDQVEVYFAQADFGFVKQQLREMKIICEPTFTDDSSLECSDHLRFCRGRNVMVNFTQIMQTDDPIRYNMDVLKEGDIGGYCTLFPDRLSEHLDHMSPLQSWAPELKNFKRLNQRPINEGHCDVIVEKPTVIMKIDATVNMYHHFCDFFNLYASLHLNISDIDIFSTDIHILIWESYTYRSAFEDTFKAFTMHPIWDLKTFRGKTVCFRNLILPLLPRMIFGLYYNTPVIQGCKSSGLFKAFSEHLNHRLKVPFYERVDKRIKITLLSRDTKYRRINNENELMQAIEEDDDYIVEKVVFNRDMSFLKQLEISRNTDVLIGIHGAGLTHLLFMPDWGSVFEIYNCEDPNCYMDLTRLRGLKYVTWTDSDKLQKDETIAYEGAAHAKFTNYVFDVNEFVTLVKEAANHVKTHPTFLKYIKDQEVVSRRTYATILEIHNNDNEFEFDDDFDQYLNETENNVTNNGHTEL